MVETSLMAVFLIGLLGGIHCAGMCGGIVSALGMLGGARPVRSPVPAQRELRSPLPGLAQGPVQALARGPAAKLLAVGHANANGTVVLTSPDVSTIGARLAPRHDHARLMAYNAGRIGTYTALGALAGAVGSTVWLLESLLPVQQIAFVIANLTLILLGLYLMGVRRLVDAIESVGLTLWRRVQPLASRHLGGQGVADAWLAGSLWGLVPCGMVYGVLMSALVSGSALSGAALMLAFGLGTLPNLLLLGWSGQWLARLRRQRWVRRAAGGLIVLFGVIGLLRIDAFLSVPILGELCIRLH